MNVFLAILSKFEESLVALLVLKIQRQIQRCSQVDYSGIQSGKVAGGSKVQGCFQKKIFLYHKNFSFFAQKKLLHYGLLCIEKCKPALTYK